MSRSAAMACLQIRRFTKTSIKKTKRIVVKCCQANINRILESCVSSFLSRGLLSCGPYPKLWKGTIHGAIQAAVWSNRSKVASHPTDNPPGIAPQHKLPSKLAAHIDTRRMSQVHIKSELVDSPTVPPQAKHFVWVSSAWVRMSFRTSNDVQSKHSFVGLALARKATPLRRSGGTAARLLPCCQRSQREWGKGAVREKTMEMSKYNC